MERAIWKNDFKDDFKERFQRMISKKIWKNDLKNALKDNLIEQFELERTVWKKHFQKIGQINKYPG